MSAQTLPTAFRNNCLDFAKGIACILVLFLHSRFPGTLGDVIQSLSRYCMPFFFMVSGYFAYSTREQGREQWRLSKIRHIGLITLWSSLFYLLIAILADSLPLTSLKGWAKFLLLNEPHIFAGQMWYLYALLYVYLIWALIDRRNWYRFAYIAAIVLFVCYLLLAQGAYFAGFSINPAVYRNFLFLGFPHFMLGNWLRRNREKLHISNRLLLTVAIVTTLLCPVERFLVGRVFGVQLVSYPQGISIFLLSIQNPSFGADSKLTVLGRRYSMYIYILQFFVIRVFRWIYARLSLENHIPAQYLQPLLVLAGTLALSVLVLFVKEHILTKQVKPS